MQDIELIERLVDLTDPTANVILNNMSPAAAAEAVALGDPERVRAIDGQFAIVQKHGKIIRMARSLGRPLRISLPNGMPGRRWLSPNGLIRSANIWRAKGWGISFDPPDANGAGSSLDGNCRRLPRSEPHVDAVFQPDPQPIADRSRRYRSRLHRGALSGDSPLAGCHRTARAAGSAVLRGDRQRLGLSDVVRCLAEAWGIPVAA